MLNRKKSIYFAYILYCTFAGENISVVHLLSSPLSFLFKVQFSLTRSSLLFWALEICSLSKSILTFEKLFDSCQKVIKEIKNNYIPYYLQPRLLNCRYYDENILCFEIIL